MVYSELHVYSQSSQSSHFAKIYRDYVTKENNKSVAFLKNTDTVNCKHRCSYKPNADSNNPDNLQDQE